jgi:hypothetical protein
MRRRSAAARYQMVRIHGVYKILTPLLSSGDGSRRTRSKGILLIASAA